MLHCEIKKLLSGKPCKDLQIVAVDRLVVLLFIYISVAQCKTVIIAEFLIVLQRQQRFEVRVFGSVHGLHVAFNNHKAKRCVISKIRPHVKETKA